MLAIPAFLASSGLDDLHSQRETLLPGNVIRNPFKLQLQLQLLPVHFDCLYLGSGGESEEWPSLSRAFNANHYKQDCYYTMDTENMFDT